MAHQVSTPSGRWFRLPTMARDKAPEPIPAIQKSPISTKSVSSPPPTAASNEAKVPLEEDQKKVVLVENMTSTKPNAHDEKSKLVNGVIKELKKIDLDGGDGIKRDIITLSGANEGARMKIVNYKKKEKRVKGTRERMVTFINSNVEGINNSIVGNSSCSYHNPGIHASLFTNLD